MLDHPRKTPLLIEALKAALPFEVELTGDAVKLLIAQNRFETVTSGQIVPAISYFGDEGGILCHIQPEGEKIVIIISLTHIRMSKLRPLAADVAAYQKRRVRKLQRTSSYLNR